MRRRFCTRSKEAHRAQCALEKKAGGEVARERVRRLNGQDTGAGLGLIVVAKGLFNPMGPRM